MRFVTFLILSLFYLSVKSSPTDTVRYTISIPTSVESYYTPKIAYIYKQDHGGYQVTLVLPDVYYWPRNPDMVIKVIDMDTKLITTSDVLYDIEKGRTFFLRPGKYIVMIFVISHCPISYFGDTCYIIELE